MPELTKEIIGAASSFNAQRSESLTSLIPMYDMDNNFETDEDDEEDIIHDSTQSYRIQPSYSRMRTGL